MTPERLPDAAPSNWVDRFAPTALRPWLKLGRFDRPTGIWLLMLPGWQGLALAASMMGEWPSPKLLLLFGLGAALMRAAGCAYNDIVDRDIDARVARTANRPVASGQLSVAGAWVFLIACALASLVILLSFNLLSVLLGVISLGLVAAYPFMKRITWWPQAWLGLTFNWGALLGFAAQTGRLDIGDGILYAGLIFWTLGYDTIYAHQDKGDDELIGVKSTARLFGENSRAWIIRFYAIAFTLILAAGFTEHTGWAFAFVMLAAGAHLVWQVKTLNPDNPDNCLAIFRSNREAGALIALAFLLASWLA